jgi:hypothetical protein
VKAGGRRLTNHNETLVRDAKPSGPKVRTAVKAGGRYLNHNEMLVRDAKPTGLKVRTAIKAGRGTHFPEVVIELWR